jgi:hypothetical protein
MSCKIDDSNKTRTNGYFLYFTNDNDWVSTSKANYYVTGVQVATRHNKYATARKLAYDALERINANRKLIAGVYYIPNSVPVYAGVDESGGYLYIFDVMLKGAK